VLTSDDVKRRARELGFDACGIAPAVDLPVEAGPRSLTIVDMDNDAAPGGTDLDIAVLSAPSVGVVPVDQRLGGWDAWAVGANLKAYALTGRVHAGDDGHPGREASERVAQRARGRRDEIRHRLAQRRSPAGASAALPASMPQRASAASSATRASTQRSPSGVVSFFQNGACVFR